MSDDNYFPNAGYALLIHGAVLAAFVWFTSDYTAWDAVFVTLLNGLGHLAYGRYLK